MDRCPGPSGTLTRVPLSTIAIDDATLVVTWSLAVPVETVWAAFSDPDLLAQCLGRAIEYDLAAGGHLVVDHGDGYLCSSAVTEARPPHRLALTWQSPDELESRVAITLRASAAGTEVELVHSDLGDLVESYGPGGSPI